MEDGHSLPQLTHVWSVLLRHADLFYPNRDQLVPQMSNSLPRIGLHPNAGMENRKLGVDLAELIIKCVQRETRESSSRLSFWIVATV